MASKRSPGDFLKQVIGRSIDDLLKAQRAMASKRSPGDFLKQVIGRSIAVKLNNGLEYRGVLTCLDGYMNIAMSGAAEYQDGDLIREYGDAFIRGNNVLYLRQHHGKK